MSVFRAVLFDMSHTLLEPSVSSEALVDVAGELGVEVDAEAASKLLAEIDALARSPEEMARGRDLSPEVHRAAWANLFQPLDSLAPGLGLPMALYERGIDARYWTLYPDTLPTLRTLREREVAIGVVSDFGVDIRGFFVHHGLMDLVDAFVISCERGVAKPEPSLFLGACAELGVAPEHTLMVGDNWCTDGGAVEAGLTCLLLPRVRPGQPRGLDHVVKLIA